MTGSSPNQQSNPKYIVKVGEAGAHRLGVLHQIFWPSTEVFLKRAGLTKGMTAIDAGCGIGYITMEMAKIVGSTGRIIAIDDSQAQLDIAAKNAEEAGIHNITFLRGRIEEAHLHCKEPVDFVYGRFVLMHVPEPLIALQSLYKTLKPEGIIAFEEPDMGSCFAQPTSDAFTKAISWHLACGKALGLRFDIGNALFFMMRLIGLKNTQLHITQPAATQHPTKSIFSLLTAECKDKYIANQIATSEQVDDTVKELLNFEKSPVSYYGCALQFQVFGQKPAQTQELEQNTEAELEEAIQYYSSARPR